MVWVKIFSLEIKFNEQTNGMNHSNYKSQSSIALDLIVQRTLEISSG